jgi:hypothetical protein
MAGRMPERVRLRGPKVGFPLPLYAWFAGPLKAFILDTAARARFLASPYWDGRKVRQAIKAIFAAERHGALRPLWSFVQTARLIELLEARAARRSAPSVAPVAAIA